MNLLFKKRIEDPVYEEEIDDLLEKIKERNKFTTNKIVIPGNIALEFIKIIKDKLEQFKMNLGILVVDIKNMKFSVKKFIKKTEGIPYTLKLKISSIDDLPKREIKFLKKHPEIIYEYADEDYNLDELFEIVEKIKKFIKSNEHYINFSQKNYLRSNTIAEIVFKNIRLDIPENHKEGLTLDKIDCLQNLSNILEEKVADYLGMRKLCKECLRIDGYKMVERVSTLGNVVGTELIIDDIEYGIKITPEEMRIIRV